MNHGCIGIYLIARVKKRNGSIVSRVLISSFALVERNSRYDFPFLRDGFVKPTGVNEVQELLFSVCIHI